MSKFLFFLILLIGIFLYLFNYDEKITNNLHFINAIKKKYVEILISTQTKIEKYFISVKEMENLSLENSDLQNYKIGYFKLKAELEDINSSIVSDVNSTFHNLKLTNVLSYKNLGDFKELIISEDLEPNKIYGLINKEYSAGIAFKKDGENIALLNGDEKCNYAVFVGPQKAPGIVHMAPNQEFIKVKYIPIWIDIQEGDEVITSGMDNIFFEGIKVGHVVSIEKQQDIQEVTVKPYANTLNQRVFYLYKH